MRTLSTFTVMTLALLVGCGNTDKSIAKYCELEAECEGASEAECISDLTPTSSSGSDACLDAEEALLQCLGRLGNCDNYDDYWTEPVSDYPCWEEDNAVYDAC